MNSPDHSSSQSLEPARAEIELRAHQLWCQQGCPQGHDHENWIEAERQLREEYRGIATSAIPVREDVPAFAADALNKGVSDSPHAALGDRAPLATRVEEELIEPGSSQVSRSRTGAQI